MGATTLPPFFTTCATMGLIDGAARGSGRTRAQAIGPTAARDLHAPCSRSVDAGSPLFLSRSQVDKQEWVGSVVGLMGQHF
jgi:hypothetical protein